MNTISASIMRNIGLCTAPEDCTVEKFRQEFSTDRSFAESLDIRLKLWQGPNQRTLETNAATDSYNRLIDDAVSYLRSRPEFLADLFIKQQSQEPLGALLPILSIYSDNSVDLKLIKDFFTKCLTELVANGECDGEVDSKTVWLVLQLLEALFLATFDDGDVSIPARQDPTAMLDCFIYSIKHWLKQNTSTAQLFTQVCRLLVHRSQPSYGWQRTVVCELMINKLLWLHLIGGFDRWTINASSDPFSIFDRFAGTADNAYRQDRLRQYHSRLVLACRRWQYQQPVIATDNAGDEDFAAQISWRFHEISVLLFGKQRRKFHHSPKSSISTAASTTSSLLTRTVQTASQLFHRSIHSSQKITASKSSRRRPSSLRYADKLLAMVRRYISMEHDSSVEQIIDPILISRLLHCPTCTQPLDGGVLPSLHASAGDDKLGESLDYQTFHFTARYFYRLIRRSWLYQQTVELISTNLLPPSKPITNTIITESLARLLEQVEAPRLLALNDPALFAVLLVRYWQTVTFLATIKQHEPKICSSELKQVLSEQPPPIGIFTRLLIVTTRRGCSDDDGDDARDSQNQRKSCYSPLSLILETFHRLEECRAQVTRNLLSSVGGWNRQRLAYHINAITSLVMLNLAQDDSVLIVHSGDSLTDRQMNIALSTELLRDWRHRSHRKLLSHALVEAPSALSKLGVIDCLEHGIIVKSAVAHESRINGNASPVVSSDRIINALQSVVCRYYNSSSGASTPKPRLLVDLQLISVLVPSAILNMTAAGKAFWDLTLAVMDLKRQYGVDCDNDDDYDNDNDNDDNDNDNDDNYDYDYDRCDIQSYQSGSTL